MKQYVKMLVLLGSGMLFACILHLMLQVPHLTFTVTNQSDATLKELNISCNAGDTVSNILKQKMNMNKGDTVTFIVAEQNRDDTGCRLTGRFSDGTEMEPAADYMVGSAYTVTIRSRTHTEISH